MDDYEEIRRAYFIDAMSIRAIHRRYGYNRDTIRKAITEAEPQPYQIEHARPAPVIGPYKETISKLLKESDQQRRKQRYTALRIYEMLVEKGYEGSESGVHCYVSQQRKSRKQKQVYLPLGFDAGQDGHNPAEGDHRIRSMSST